MFTKNPIRTLAVAAGIGLLLSLLYCARQPSQRAEPPVVEEDVEPATTEEIDFEQHILPIFAAKCSPCHFSGGKMYEELPFDDPGTIRHLGPKLFTRIKDPDEQAALRTFLAQQTTTARRK